MTAKHTVVVQPTGRRGQIADGINLRAAVRELGIDIESICAENATCGKCKVLVQEGSFAEYQITSGKASLSPMGPEESDYLSQRAAMLTSHGWNMDQVRLACQARVHGDVLVTVPDESRADKQIVRKSATERHIDIKPSVRKYLVELTPPTISNPKADWERLASGIATSIELVRHGEPNLPSAADLTIDYACLRTLPDVLRASDWRVTVSVWQDREVLRVEPGYTEYAYGAAIDIGTTTVALAVCNLSSGEIVAAESDMNPQIAFGEDVMSRIQFSTTNPDGLEQLHKSIIRSLNRLIARAVRAAGLTTDEIVDITVVGNTTMEHFFLNLPARHLGVAPFTPAITRSLDLKARQLRLAINPSANVHILPAIASFIGADTTGVLLAEEPHEQDELWLIIDIGTNAELVLGNRRKLICASTPTGPAFEGAHIEFGMRAAPGAIEHMRIDRDSLRPSWKIIGHDEWNRGQPKGLCGTAVIDAVAELLAAGALDRGGKFVIGDHDTGRLRSGANGMEYVIAYAAESTLGVDICLTQKDVRQIQLAKGALIVAAQSLLDRFGIQAPDKILLAGAFGTYLDKVNAMAIGMIPQIPLDHVFFVGNAAGDGARIALLNVEKRREAMRVAGRLTRHELPADPEFQDRFIKALQFPATGSVPSG
jgi:uncharacterized 2Fe-2S/4Fe-4S cluster protein (DUF4445 family)